MKQYTSFFRMRFTTCLQYRSAALGGIVTQFCWGALEILLFKAFYEADAKAFPMEFSALCSYVWLQQAFLALYMTWFLESDLLKAITDGGIAYELVRPIELYHMWFARNMATRLSKAVLRSMPILVFAALLKKPYGLSLPANVGAFFWFIFSMFLALLVTVAFCMIIYVITFYTISSIGVRLVVSSLVEFLSGAIIPLPFLPKKVEQVVSLLPFASMQNAPFRIYSGDINGFELYEKVLLQMVWVFLLIIIGRFMMSRAMVKVKVQGG